MSRSMAHIGEVRCDPLQISPLHPILKGSASSMPLFPFFLLYIMLLFLISETIVNYCHNLEIKICHLTLDWNHVATKYAMWILVDQCNLHAEVIKQ